MDRVYIIINIFYLQFYSFDYRDFLLNLDSDVHNVHNVNNNNNSISANENKKLQDELNKYKKENELLKVENNKLKNENEELNKELLSAVSMLSNLENSEKNDNGNNNNFNNINHLKEILKFKDKVISDLRLKLQNNSGNNKNYVDFNKIMVVNFMSSDQAINCGIKCLESETFAQVEEKLYQQYPEYREKNNNFLAKGKVVLRFKKISENSIKDGDRIQLLAMGE